MVLVILSTPDPLGPSLTDLEIRGPVLERGLCPSENHGTFDVGARGPCACGTIHPRPPYPA